MPFVHMERWVAFAAGVVGIAAGIGYFWDKFQPPDTVPYLRANPILDASQLTPGDNSLLQVFLMEHDGKRVFLDLHFYVNQMAGRRNPRCEGDPPAPMEHNDFEFVLWTLDDNDLCTSDDGQPLPSAWMWAVNFDLETPVPSADVLTPLPHSAGAGRYSQSISGFFLVDDGVYGGQQYITLTPTPVDQPIRDATREAALGKKSVWAALRDLIVDLVS